jgi:ATP-binding protein involved in chromosome partitioning
MDESVIRAHLNEIARIDKTLSQVEDNVVDVQLEDDWAGVSLTSSLPREALRSLHAQLSERMPGYSLEIHAGDDVYRGDAGFGPGKHLIAVLGGKGGVGKTTVSVNLALTLSAMGQSVGLLDGDLTAPDVPHMFGIHRTGQEHQSTLRIWHQDVTPPSRRLYPHRRLGLELASIGFFVPERVSVELTGTRHVSSMLSFLVFEMAWTSDIILIDAPPGTGEEVQAITRTLPVSGVILVTTPQDLAQMDTERTVDLLTEASVPVIGVVQNMSELTCPHCGQGIDLFESTTRLVDTGIPLLGRIPFDVGLSTNADQGKPLVLAEPRGPIATEFASIGLHVRRWLTNGESKYIA